MEEGRGRIRIGATDWMDDLAELSAEAILRGGRPLLWMLAAVVLAVVAAVGPRAPAVPLAVALVALGWWQRSRFGTLSRMDRVARVGGWWLLGLFSVADVLGTDLGVALDVVLLVLLAVVTHTRTWRLATAVVTVAMTTAAALYGSWQIPRVALAAPLLTVLAARAAYRITRRPSGPPAAVRLAARIANRPWAASFLAATLAFLVAIEVYASIPEIADFNPGSQRWGFPFFALPGIAALTSVGLFHALHRRDAPLDVLPSAVAPMAVQGLTWLVLGAIATKGFRRGPTDLETTLALAFGLPSLLPALTGLVAGRAPPRSTSRASVWVWTALVSLAVLWALPRGNVWAELADRHEGSKGVVVHLWALFSIPALTLVHLLAGSSLRARSMLVVGLALAPLLAFAAALVTAAGSREPARADVATGVAALGALTAVLIVATASIARRLREITPLPVDHPVLHWEAALRADEARQ